MNLANEKVSFFYAHTQKGSREKRREEETKSERNWQIKDIQRREEKS